MRGKILVVSDKRVATGINVLSKDPPRAFVTVDSAGVQADLELDGTK